MILEFKNKGKYKSIIKDVSKEPTCLILSTQKILNSEQISYLQEFLIALDEEVQKDFKYSDAAKITVEEKINNTIGAIAYSSFAKLSSEKLKDLIYSLASVQLLADLGDTISDTYDNQANLDSVKNETKDFYLLNFEIDSSIKSFLRKNIQKVLEQGALEQVNLFNIRWSEFIDYQLITIVDNSQLYETGLIDISNNSAQKRLSVFGSFSKYNLSPIEYSASKGGTTYLLNILRSILLDEKFDIKKFDEENTLFDYLNFACDHVSDIATDSGFKDLIDMQRFQKCNDAKIQNNAVNIYLKSDLGIVTLSKDNIDIYISELKDYFFNLLSKTYNIVKRNNGINYLLYKPMIAHFFTGGNPSKEFSNEVLKYIVNIE